MPESEPAGARSSSVILWLNGLMVVCGLCLAGLLGAVAIRNSDVWMHLATGRAIAQGDYRIGVDPFGFSTADRVWVNHSWLFDLGLYELYKSAGGTGLAIARSAVAVLLFAAL